MSLNINFVSQSISRATLRRSKLPQNATCLQHAVNNLASASKTKLLYVGDGLSYAVYENDHIETITWLDEDLTRAQLDAYIFRPEYNLIVANQHMFKTSLLKILQNHLSKKTLLVVLGSRFYSSNEIIARSLVYNDHVKIVSKLEINDRNNDIGWGDGMTIFDLTIKS